MRQKQVFEIEGTFLVFKELAKNYLVLLHSAN